MHPAEEPFAPDQAEGDRIRRLEERVARLEEFLRLESKGAPENPFPTASPLPDVAAGPEAQRREEEFEFEVGQNWFALAGIFALTAGVAFLLSLPHARLPLAAPGLAGIALAGGLLAAIRYGHKSLAVVAPYLRGSAMALLGFSGLRLFYFGPQPVLELGSLAGRAILLLCIGANFAIAARALSPWLTSFAFAIGSVMALATHSAEFALPVVVALAGVTLTVGRREDWPAMPLVGQAVSYAAYLWWAVGGSLATGRLQFTREPPWATATLLTLALLWGAAPLLRRESFRDDAVANISAFFACAVGYGAFLVHTAAAIPRWFAAAHFAAAAGFLVLAIVFFVREHSRVSTFFYAMTGYAALSFAILKLSTAPNVFVWLSLQSLVVVTTAICFRSRFIVVANFFIYLAIVAGYLVVTTRETGISVGFGIVALVSARILNWKKDRLELRTELMRNAYLVSAFAVFPYAVHHLLPTNYVALGWVGLAAAYYVVSLVVRNQKYRWMGHGTLALAMLYLVLTAVRGFEPIYRVLSFLVLGTALLIVSLSFSRARRKRKT